MLANLRVTVDAVSRVFASQTVTQQSPAPAYPDVGAVVVVVVAAADETPRRVRQRNTRIHRRALLDGSAGRKVALEPLLVVEVERRVARPVAEAPARRRRRRANGSAPLEGVDRRDFVLRHRRDDVEGAAAAAVAVIGRGGRGGGRRRAKVDVFKTFFLCRRHRR
jgi:hypothetical protein